MKNILHFSTTDYGGAGSAAYRIHNNLNLNGFNSKMIVISSRTNDSSVLETNENKIKLFIKKLHNRLLIRLGILSSKYNFYGHWNNAVKRFGQIENLVKDKPDIIILHWISGLINLQVVKELQLKYNCKVYWYLMDMAPMTGGCHYAWDCKGYSEECINCPAVNFPYLNLPHKIVDLKKHISNELKIEVISGTGLLSKQLKKSSIFCDSKIHEIMLSIDENTFFPLSESSVEKFKKKYNIPLNKRVCFFGASNIEDERKGFKYLLQALKKLSEDESFNNNSLVVAVAGNIKNKSIFNEINFEIIYLGFLKGNTELASAYQVADLFISPSIEDSGPMMVNESIMCGTPVVAFETGVALDLIKADQTGFLVKLKDIGDMAKAIKKMIELSDYELEQMKKNCRKLGLVKTSNQVTSQQLIKLINEGKV